MKAIQTLLLGKISQIEPYGAIALIIGVLLAFSMLISCNSSHSVKPKVENGTINLTQWDFDKSGPAALDGEWRFKWQHLISPKNAEFIDDQLYVPNHWIGKTKSGVSLTQQGFGTYALSILLPESEGRLAFYMPLVKHASTIWINGKQVFQAGKVANNRESMVPGTSRDLFFVDLDEREIKLVMQVSNFVHRTGGIETSLLIGPKDQIMHLRTKNVFIEAFLAGSLVFTALLHFMIAMLFTQKRAAIFFGFICLNIALYGLVNGEQILAYLAPSSPWVLRYKIDYLTAFAFPVPLIVSFIFNLFPHPKTKNIVTIIIGIGLLSSIFIISSPVHTFSRALNYFEILLVFQCTYVAFLLVVAIQNRKQGSGILLFGGFILLLTAINDMFFYAQQIDIGPLAVIGFWFFLLCQAFAFAIQFMTEFNRLKRISVNLEWQVNERTRNLQQANLKLQEEIKNKEEIEEKLRILSQTDPLTKIDNRYKFNETLDEEIRRVNRYGGSLSIIMFDIDHFKMVNDTWGHDVGDRVLVNVAQLVENMVRDIDSFARWGGEEFIILTPNNEIDGAAILAERIRETIEMSDFTPVNTLTASFGVIGYIKNEEKTSLLKRVDEALYSAKFHGRNQVISKEE